MLRQVLLQRYAKVRPTTFGLVGRQRIAVIRASGTIVGGESSVPGDNIQAAEVQPKTPGQTTRSCYTLLQNQLLKNVVELWVETAILTSCEQASIELRSGEGRGSRQSRAGCRLEGRSSPAALLSKRSTCRQEG